MSAIVEKDRCCTQARSDINRLSCGPWRIAIGVPDWQPLFDVMNGKPANATYVLQRYVADGLKARGHSLTLMAPRDLEQMVCTTDPQTPSAAAQTWSRSRWFDFVSRGTWHLQQWLGVPYLNVFSNYRRLDACLQSLPGHDVVYERHGLYRSGVAMACRRLKLPYMIFFEADEILEFDFMGKPITGLLRKRAIQVMHYNLRTATRIICVSEALKHHLVVRWRVAAEKILVFPNGVDVQRFRPDKSANFKVRSTLRLETNPLIIFVGNFYAWHDVSTLLEAFSRLINVKPEVRLLLVGDGDLRQAMVQRTIDLGIQSSVRFTGLLAHAEVPELMAAADVAVVPYPVMKHDLWLSPLKLFEYMASGTAVVASRVGQLKDVIQDNHNGLLVPPGNASAMAAALKRLIDDPTLRLRLGQQARKDAVRKHSWDEYLSRLEKVFGAVIAGEAVIQI